MSGGEGLRDGSALAGELPPVMPGDFEPQRNPRVWRGQISDAARLGISSHTRRARTLLLAISPDDR